MSPNLYSYASGNPILATDPLGLWPVFGMWGPEDTDAAAAIGRLWYFYKEMKRVGWTNDAKYFHCLAHCNASRFGTAGKAISFGIGFGREAIDFPWKSNMWGPDLRFS